MSYGGNGSGSGRIATSSDAALNNPTDGQLLSYDGSTQKWRNVTLDTLVATLISSSSSATGAAIRSLSNPTGNGGSTGSSGGGTSALSSIQDVAYASGQAKALSVSASIPIATHIFVVSANPGQFVDLAGSDANGGVRIYATGDNRFQMYVAGGAYLTQTNAAIDWTKKNIIAVEYDASTGMIASYLNGVPIGTDRRSGGWTFTAGTHVAVGTPVIEYRRYTRALYGTELKSLFSELGTTHGVTLSPAVSSTTTVPLTLTGLKGSNIHPKSSQFSGGLGVFANFWGPQWDYAWVTDSIDKTKLRGGTVVRLIGDVQAIQSGQISQATYTSRLTQIADYVASKNMRLYYCGADINQRGNAVQADFVNQYKAAAQVLEAHSANVYGFDLANEIRATYGSTPQATSMPWMQACSTAIRQVAPNVSLSISDIGGGGSDDGGSAGGVLSRAACFSQYQAWAPYVDFFDVHAYEDTTGDLQPWHLAPYELSVNRPMSIGEFGANIGSVGDSEGAALYSRAKALRNASSSVVGIEQWAIRNDGYGLYDEATGAVRTATAAIWDTV